MPYIARENSNSLEVSGTIGNRLTLTDSAATYSLGSITLPQLKGKIERVIMELQILQMQNTNAGTNAFSGDSSIQMEDAGATWRTGINLSGSYVYLAGTSYADGLFTFTGTTDVKDYIAAGGTYNLRWKDVACIANNIYIHGYSVKFKIYFI